MKIAIMTFHRSINYGSLLQAYALNFYLRSIGHEVETIDYHNENQEKLYQEFQKARSMMSLARNAQTLWHLAALKTKKKRFYDFFTQYIPASEFSGGDRAVLADMNDKYDLFICGSDQIWNKSCWDFDTAYMLDFVKNKSQCCSYAASIGASEIDSITQELLQKYIADFKMVSVREKSSAMNVSTALKRPVDWVLDPVFLLPREEWAHIAAPAQTTRRKGYILCYFIGDVVGMRKFAVKLSKQTGLDLVVITKNLRDVLYANQKRFDTGPREFLQMIIDAEYICTDSFHAVAFSVIFKKKFWVFVNKQNTIKPQVRIFDIAATLGLEERILEEATSHSILLEHEMDWPDIYNRLDKQIERSKQYLEDCCRV